MFCLRVSRECFWQLTLYVPQLKNTLCRQLFFSSTLMRSCLFFLITDFVFFLLNSLLLKNNEFLMYLYNALESPSPLSNFLVSRMVNNINQRTLCSENSTTRKVMVGHFSVQLKLTLNLFHLKKIISCSQNT